MCHVAAVWRKFGRRKTLYPTLVACIGKLKDDVQYNHAAQRLMDLAKLLGLVIDKHELKGNLSTAPMPWEAMYSDNTSI